MIVRRANAKNSDQTTPNAALIALRDKYRKMAIRTWDRFESATKILKGRTLRSKMLGFQSRRDYYIYAAEAVGGMVGVPVSVEGDQPESAESSSLSSAGLPTITPAANSEEIDTGSTGAVATEEK